MEHVKPGTVFGRAFSGTVVAVGTAVPATHPQMRPGVRVAGLASQGAFAEYVRVPARVVWTVPANARGSPLTDAQAAAMGAGIPFIGQVIGGAVVGVVASLGSAVLSLLL